MHNFKWFLALTTASLLSGCTGKLQAVLKGRDKQIPTLEVADKAALPWKLSLRFPSVVSGVTNEVFAVTNASVTAIDGSGDTFQISIWPQKVGTISIGVINDAVVYKSGNKAQGSNVLNLDFSDSAPEAGSSGVITASSLSQTGVTLTWTAASDAVTGPSKMRYQVVRSTKNNIDTLEDANLNGQVTGPLIDGVTKADLTGIDTSATSWFNIIASDEFGNQVAYKAINVLSSGKISTDGDQLLVGGVLYSLTKDRLQLVTLNSGSLSGATITSLNTIQGRFMMKNGNYLYIVSTNGLSLLTYNVTTPSAPVLLSTVTLPYPATLGRLSSPLVMLSHGTSNAITIWSLTDPTTPTLAKTHTSNVSNCVDMIYFASMLFALNRDNATISTYSLTTGSPGTSAYVRSMSLAGSVGFSKPTKMAWEDRQFWVSFDGDVSGLGYYDILEYFGRVIGEYRGKKISKFVFDRNRLFAFAPDEEEVTVYNVKNPKNISILRTVAMSRSSLYSLSSVVLANNRLYVSDGPDLFESDVSSSIEPSSPWYTLGTGSGASATGFSPTAVAYDSNTLLVGNGSGFGLQAYSLSTASAPTLLSEVTHAGSIAQVDVNATLVVTLSTAGILRVYDRSLISNLSSALLGQITLSATANLVDMKLHGTKAYITVAGTTDKLLTVSLATPASPTEGASLTLSDNPGVLAVSGNTLYVLEPSTKKIAVIDLTQALAIATRIDVTSDTIGSPSSLGISGSRLYVGVWGNNYGWGNATGYAGVSIINIASPNTPTAVEFYRFYTGANIGVSRGYIWMSHYYLSFSPPVIYDVGGAGPLLDQLTFTNNLPSSVTSFRGYDDFVFALFGSTVRYIKTAGDLQLNP